MIAAEYLYELATECSDLAAHIAKLDDQELVALASQARHLQTKQDTPGGVPVLVDLLCDREAAIRFYNQTKQQNA